MTSRPRTSRRRRVRWGSPLEKRRLELRYSRPLLAERAGIHPGTIKDLEYGVYMPTLRTARALAAVLDTSVDGLFPLNDESRAHQPGSVTTTATPDGQYDRL